MPYIYSIGAYRNYADCTKEEFLGMYRSEACEAARQGYGLEHLVHHHDIRVREEVAKKGYCLDILAHDEYWGVRLEVAKQDSYFASLLKDDEKPVVAQAAKKKLGILSFADLSSNFFKKYYVEIGGKNFNLICCHLRPIEFHYYDRPNDEMHLLHVVDESELACAEGTKQEDFDNSLLTVLRGLDKEVVIKARF